MAYRTRYFPPLSIETNQLPTNVVVEDKIAPGAVTGDKIEDGSVGTPDLASSSVTSIKIAGSAVTSDKIAPGAVDPTKLSFTPVTRPLTPQVSTSEIADGAVTSDKMAAAIIDTDQIVDEAVTTAKIAPDSIDNTKIGASAVTSQNIATGAVGTDELSTDAVETVKIKDGAVTDPKLATDSVITVKIKDANVTLAKMAPDSVDTGNILDDAITTPKILDQAIDEDKLSLNSIADFLGTRPLFYDDFDGAALSHVWATSGDPGLLVSMSPESEVAFQTGPVANDKARLNFNGVKSFRFTMLPHFLTRVRVQTLTNVKFETGLLASSSIYALFRYDSSVSPNWLAVTRDGGGETETDTGIAASFGFTNLRIDYNSAAEVKFYVDGVLADTAVSDIPGINSTVECWAEVETLTGSARAVPVGYMIVAHNRLV